MDDSEIFALGGGGSVDQDADLDLAGRDHLDVDTGFSHGLEHLASDAGMRPHPQADDGDLGDLRVVRDATRTHGPWLRPARLRGLARGRRWRR